jgi:sugar lactone lactonase YvrE
MSSLARRSLVGVGLLPASRHGRAWIGCFGFVLMSFADPRLAPLMRVDPDGTATLAADDLMFPNGSVITPDGST